VRPAVVLRAPVGGGQRLIVEVADQRRTRPTESANREAPVEEIANGFGPPSSEASPLARSSAVLANFDFR
jgi:hypothetical protein